MIEVVQAFDRTPLTRLDSDDKAALDRKIDAAHRLFANRGAWLKERPGDLERRSTPWQPRISEPDHSTDRKGDQHRDQHPEQSEEKYRQDRNSQFR